MPLWFVYTLAKHYIIPLTLTSAPLRFVYTFMAFLDKIRIKSCTAGILPPRIIHIKAKFQFNESLCRLILV